MRLSYNLAKKKLLEIFDDTLQSYVVYGYIKSHYVLELHSEYKDFGIHEKYLSSVNSNQEIVIKRLLFS